MGADLIIAGTLIRDGRKPDWSAAERLVETITFDDFDKESGSGAFYEMEDTEELRSYLRASLAEFRQTFEDGWARDFTWVKSPGFTVYVAGGTSWGDSPGDTFDLICNLSETGVLEAAGFDQSAPYDEIESIARQVLGHAYPNRTFDELTAEEIADVADNLKHADEVLANVMPIVVSESYSSRDDE